MDWDRRTRPPLGEWVRQLRKRLDGNDVAAFADRFGVTPETVRGWEARGKPGAGAVAKMERLAGHRAPGRDAETDLERTVRRVIREELAPFESVTRQMAADLAAVLDAARLVVAQAARAQPGAGTPEPPVRARLVRRDRG